MTADCIARLPDEARWVEARALLISGRGEIIGEDPRQAGFFVADKRSTLACPCFKPSESDLKRLLAHKADFGEAIATWEEREHIAALLPAWKTYDALLLTLPAAVQLPAPGTVTQVLMLDRLSNAQRSDLPEHWVQHLDRAFGRGPVAAALADGLPVSYCHSFCATESLWCVSVQTLPEFRRRGLASACTVHLIHRMRSEGRQPVWGATKDNGPSIEFAARRGFELTGRAFYLNRHERADRP